MVGEKIEICLSELVENGPIIIHIVSSPPFLKGEGGRRQDII